MDRKTAQVVRYIKKRAFKKELTVKAIADAQKRKREFFGCRNTYTVREVLSQLEISGAISALGNYIEIKDTHELDRLATIAVDVLTPPREVDGEQGVNIFVPADLERQVRKMIFNYRIESGIDSSKRDAAR